MRIRGNTVGFPNPQTDWEQDNERLADFLQNKPESLYGPAVTGVSGVRDGQTITLTFALDNGGEDVIVMTTDTNDVPTGMTINGVEVPVELEGF